MPLDKSGTEASVGKNIKAEIKAGKPKKQAIAIALNVEPLRFLCPQCLSDFLSNKFPVTKEIPNGK